MKIEFHQGRSLYILAFDVMNAADIQEVVLVVVGEQTFHLCGVHAAIRLAHVNHRQIQTREDVHRHAFQRQFDTVHA